MSTSQPRQCRIINVRTLTKTHAGHSGGTKAGGGSDCHLDCVTTRMCTPLQKNVLHCPFPASCLAHLVRLQIPHQNTAGTSLYAEAARYTPVHTPHPSCRPISSSQAGAAQLWLCWGGRSGGSVVLLVVVRLLVARTQKNSSSAASDHTHS